MSDITTFSGLEAVLIGIVQEALEAIGEKVENHMKSVIDKDVYSANTPNQYDRTYQLKESVTTSDVKSVIRGGSFYLYHDTSKIKADVDNFQHGSPQGGDMSKYIPEIVAFNKSGNLFGYGWWHKRANYYQDTLEDLRDKGLLSKWFREELRKRGVDVV